MNRTRSTLLASLTLVALLSVAQAAGAKTLAATPDLVVKKVSKPPATATVGSKFRTTVTVGNDGDAKAGASKLGLYLGKGKKPGKKDKRLKRVGVKPLDPGKSKKLKLRFTLPGTFNPGDYRLFACADDKKQVAEVKERNCRATTVIRLLPDAETLRRTPPLPLDNDVVFPPAAAFTMTDGVDWGFVQNAEGDNPNAGDPITLTLTAGNGIPGQAGYSRSSVPSENFRTGVTTTLDFPSPGDEDDGQVTRSLPFAFPFGGVKEQSISVSTNGWISFGSPAWDYWDGLQPYDYRGVQAVLGEVNRGLMPYWADLDASEPAEGAGTVKEVIAPDGSWVAYQWDIGQHNFGGLPRRSFQLVLFPDGRFRFDYPGENAPGGQPSFVGYSLGTGAASADIVSAGGQAVPPSGLLFTPNPLPAGAGTAAGQLTAILPKGSTFSSAPGCSLTAPPMPFATGLVTCPVAGLTFGEQTTRAVTFLAPPNPPGESRPANFRLLGAYQSQGLSLTDGDEINSLSNSLVPTTIDITLDYTGGNIEAGVLTAFRATIESPDSLDEPTATFTVGNATLSAVEIDGETIECTGLGGSSATCFLPSGTSGAQVDLTVVPISTGPLELATTAQALNAPLASQAILIAP